LELHRRPRSLRDGTLLACCEIAVEKERSPQLLFHNFEPANALFNAERVAVSGELWICPDPLQVPQAVESGIQPESVIRTKLLRAQGFGHSSAPYGPSAGT
jgi:hypothetical protein